MVEGDFVSELFPAALRKTPYYHVIGGCPNAAVPVCAVVRIIGVICREGRHTVRSLEFLFIFKMSYEIGFSLLGYTVGKQTPVACNTLDLEQLTVASAVKIVFIFLRPHLFVDEFCKVFNLFLKLVNAVCYVKLPCHFQKLLAA